MGWAIDDAAAAALLADHPAVVAGATEVAEAVQVEAQSIAVREAYDSGDFVAGILAVPATPGRPARARATVDHSAPLEGGTGLYGPRHAPIVAQGHPFVFDTRLPPGGDGLLQAHDLGGVERTLVLWQHNGMPGRHIMVRAAVAVAAGSPELRFVPRDWEVTAE